MVHRDLRPDSILLDWDWNVRLCDFGHSLYPGNPYWASLNETRPGDRWAYVDAHGLAPECYDHQYFMESDVFSFALILYELMVRKLPFSKSLKQSAVAKLLVLDDTQPGIPDFVLLEVADPRLLDGQR
jgi:serine/threonine protein kinase